MRMPFEGFKTVFWNGLVIGLIAMANYVAGIDWTQYVSPSMAMLITAGVNFFLRFVTDSPVFQKK